MGGVAGTGYLPLPTWPVARGAARCEAAPPSAERDVTVMRGSLCETKEGGVADAAPPPLVWPAVMRDGPAGQTSNKHYPTIIIISAATEQLI